MNPRRLAVALVIVVVAASVGVGAATPGVTDASAVGTPAAATNTTPLGHSISSVMQSSTAQAAGAVENGMWAAAYANASNDTERRALVEKRYGQLNGSVGELQAERAALQEVFRNGSMNRSTYLARLSAIVGRLAALGEGIESAGERGAAVGVNDFRLATLRSQARNLSGAEVSALARNLTGGQGAPGSSGVFDEAPGRSGDRGPGNATNRSSGDGGPGQGAGNAGNNSKSGNAGDNSKSGNAGDNSKGDDAGNSNSGNAGGNGSAGGSGGGDGTTTATPTPTGD